MPGDGRKLTDEGGFHVLAKPEFVALHIQLPILTELARKLDEKFGWEKQRIAQLITSISNLATVFKTTPWLQVNSAISTASDL